MNNSGKERGDRNKEIQAANDRLLSGEVNSFWNKMIRDIHTIELDEDSQLDLPEIADFSEEIKEDPSFTLNENARSLLKLTGGDASLVIDLGSNVTDVLSKIAFPNNANQQELLKLALEVLAVDDLRDKDIWVVHSEKDNRETLLNLPLINAGKKGGPENTLLGRSLLLVHHVWRQGDWNSFLRDPSGSLELYKEKANNAKLDKEIVPSELKESDDDKPLDDEVPDWLQDIAKEEGSKQQPKDEEIAPADIPDWLRQVKEGGKSLSEEDQKPEEADKDEINSWLDDLDDLDLEKETPELEKGGDEGQEDSEEDEGESDDGSKFFDQFLPSSVLEKEDILKKKSAKEEGKTPVDKGEGVELESSISASLEEAEEIGYIECRPTENVMKTTAGIIREGDLSKPVRYDAEQFEQVIKEAIKIVITEEVEGIKDLSTDLSDISLNNGAQIKGKVSGKVKLVGPVAKKIKLNVKIDLNQDLSLKSWEIPKPKIGGKKVDKAWEGIEERLKGINRDIATAFIKGVKEYGATIQSAKFKVEGNHLLVNFWGVE